MGVGDLEEAETCLVVHAKHAIEYNACAWFLNRRDRSYIDRTC